jgi:hypothetical protein
MSTKVTLATLAVLLAAVSAASAQTYFPAFPAAANGQPSQTVNRLKALASQNSTRPYITPQQNEAGKQTYPEYPFQNGGGG